jgi:hypothetical protein
MYGTFISSLQQAPQVSSQPLTSAMQSLRQEQVILSLIPIVTDAARNSYSEHEEDETMTSQALTHADYLNIRLYGIKVGSINKTRYQIFPDHMEVAAFCKENCGQCIKGMSLTSVSFNSQLTNIISTHNDEAMESNRLDHQEIERTINKEETRRIELRSSTLQL